MLKVSHLIAVHIAYVFDVWSQWNMFMYITTDCEYP